MKKIITVLSLSGVAAFTACGPHTSQQQDSYTSTDAAVAIQQTKEQSAAVSVDSSTGKHLTEGQTGERSGTGGLPGQSVADRTFISDEVMANSDEIKVANLALQHSSSSDIKSLAGMLIKDYTEAIAQLKKLALEKGISLTSKGTTGVNDMVKKVSNKPGDQFNKEWCQTMINLHKKTISTYQARADNTTDENLKAWISGILPKLQSHLDMLTTAQKKLAA